MAKLGSGKLVDGRLWDPRQPWQGDLPDGFRGLSPTPKRRADKRGGAEGGAGYGAKLGLGQGQGQPACVVLGLAGWSIGGKGPSRVSTALFCMAVDPGKENAISFRPTLGWRGQHLPEGLCCLRILLRMFIFQAPEGNDAEGVPSGARNSRDLRPNGNPRPQI